MQDTTERMDETPFAAQPPRQGGRAKGFLAIAVLAFLGGLVLAGWLVWNGQFARYFPRNAAERAPVAAVAPSPTASASAPSPLTTVEARVAMLEQRLAAIDSRADAASGNAARAEALLVAFAARRLIDRGQPLGYLEGQLQLRFGNAQPNAVQTLVDASTRPVTLDQLLAQFDAAAPRLAAVPDNLDAWSRVKRELAGLVVIRRQATPSPAPARRAERARLLLTSGRVADAVEEVRRMPGANAAGEWISLARRYGTVQQALDLIETTAMLEPSQLVDGKGEKVEQPSPLASPVDPEKAI